MQSEQQYSNLVYEFFLKRIQFGYYKCGDLLPSIDVLCRELIVSAQTVKAALQRLRGEGYIDMHNGRSTKVIAEKTPEQARQFTLDYFSHRVKSFHDLYQSSRLVIMPLLSEGFRRADQKDLDYLARLAEGETADDILHFFCFVLQKLDNPLLMNLYWETSIFWGLLFLKQNGEQDLSDVRLMHQEMQRCMQHAACREWDRLFEELQTFRQHSVGTAVDILIQSVPPAKDEDQIPFQWRIYRERPQVCYSLASHLLHEIYMGNYQEADWLPSYEKMARTYGVSMSTVRRTIKVLNQLGAVRSINGKGTRVFRLGDPCETPDFESSVVRRNLSFFVQSYELLVYSCEPVMKDFLAASSPTERKGLLKGLEDNLASGRCDSSFWLCLLSIARYSRLQGIREIYGQIYSLFLWGYPLKASGPQKPLLEQSILCFTESMIRSLKGNDFRGCAEAMKEFVTLYFPATEGYLASNGFRPEELRLTPSIRLLIRTDEL